MVFSSTTFLFLFLPVVLACYAILPFRAKNYFLLAASLLFFAWSQPAYLWIILVSIAVNYALALLIDRLRDAPRGRLAVLWLAVAANLGLLFYFKYFDFFIEAVDKLLGLSFDIVGIVLPIGISFFTFQGMSYVIDVYRRKVPAQRNLMKVALYIALFPQLVAGPIVRYVDIAEEIDRRSVSLDDFRQGAKRFIVGLAKKAMVANAMAAVVDSIWAAGWQQNTVPIAWLGAVAYSLQIFFDFSGYSDMAIGLGRMFGFHFMENFDLPYVSKSISEFWRRWHISLSSWFRDYVYIPLGGNRRHVYLNLAVVFALTGIWHGADWQFIAWGAVHGLFMLIERWGRIHQVRADWLPAPLKGFLRHLYVLAVVGFAWVLFRAPSIHDAIGYYGTMFGIGASATPGFGLLWYLDAWVAVMLVVGVILSTTIPRALYAKLQARLGEEVLLVVENIGLLALFVASAALVVSGSYNPFIYFQF